MPSTLVLITTDTLGALYHSGQDITGAVIHRVTEDGPVIHHLEGGTNLVFQKRTLKNLRKEEL